MQVDGLGALTWRSLVRRGPLVEEVDPQRMPSGQHVERAPTRELQEVPDGLKVPVEEGSIQGLLSARRLGQPHCPFLPRTEQLPLPRGEEVLAVLLPLSEDLFQTPRGRLSLHASHD